MRAPAGAVTFGPTATILSPSTSTDQPACGMRVDPVEDLRGTKQDRLCGGGGGQHQCGEQGCQAPNGPNVRSDTRARGWACALGTVRFPTKRRGTVIGHLRCGTQKWSDRKEGLCETVTSAFDPLQTLGAHEESTFERSEGS